MSPPSDSRRPVAYDPLLLLAVVLLVGLGLVMVYSASAITAQERLGDGFFYLKRQAWAALLGLGALVVALQVGYRRLARWAPWLMLLALGLLVAVLVPGLGTAVGGARRWLRVPGVSVQPAEVAKVVWVLYLAYSLAKKKENVRRFSVGFLPHLLLLAVLCLLCLAEPDFGSAVVLVFLLFVMLFVAGARLSWLLGSLLAALPVASLLIAASPYRLRRLLSFLDPWADRQGSGYQVTESLISIGSGGLTGLGLGESKQKLFFLPEAHTDFIFSIIGEELGLLGVAALVLLYALLIWRGLLASLRATEAFGAYLALGLTALVGVQAVVNMSVAMSLLPTKGLTLPFVSYGGSSLITLMGAAGLLLSISGQPAGGGGRLLRPVPAAEPQGFESDGVPA